MAWFLGQSLLFVALAFLLGLLVGWLIWARTGSAEPEPVVAASAPETKPVPKPEARPEPEPVPAVEPVAPVEPEPELVTEAEPVVEPEPIAAVEAPDNLQRIEGIGPKISNVLVAAGIRTFRQLAATDTAELTETLRGGGVRFTPSLSSWSDQAQLLADGDEAGFNALTRQLVAGRKGR